MGIEEALFPWAEKRGYRAAAAGTRFEVLSAPLKALANRMGLTDYGRNSIGYIDGLGSYFQLIGLVTDAPVSDRSVRARSEEAALGRCRECRICAAACPTGAISLDRFLIRAERCYTLHSESMDSIPEGLVPPLPQCLVGCMKCQEACPENKGRPGSPAPPIRARSYAPSPNIRRMISAGSSYGFQASWVTPAGMNTIWPAWNSLSTPPIFATALPRMPMNIDGKGLVWSFGSLLTCWPFSTWAQAERRPFW